VTLHRSLADGGWARLTVCEQLGNVGSEVGRAIRARAAGNDARFIAAFGRAMELFDLSLTDPRWEYPRLREIARAREITCDFLVGDNEFGATAESLDRYFLAFAVAARAGW
jgi:hypothetical protein